MVLLKVIIKYIGGNLLMASKELRKIRAEKVTITLDKVRTIVYDLNAFAELEEQFGTIEEAMRLLEAGKLKAVIAILWAGLVHEDETLTPKKVGSLVGINDIEMIADALSKAISSALPESKEVTGDEGGN
jgi:hypothetical protein